MIRAFSSSRRGHYAAVAVLGAGVLTTSTSSSGCDQNTNGTTYNSRSNVTVVVKSSSGRAQRIVVRDDGSNVVVSQNVSSGRHVYRLQPGTYEFVVSNDSGSCSDTATVSDGSDVVLDCG